jgi:hypothetical protein
MRLGVFCFKRIWLTNRELARYVTELADDVPSLTLFRREAVT